MMMSLFAGCGGKGSSGGKDASADKGSVYYLNFKPEADAQWQELAKIYEEETGVKVTVVTAASGQYETTLKSEMGKSESPTLFQVNGPVGLASWKDYCYDLGSSQVYKELTSEDFALKDGDKVAGIGYVIESYGIIYNKELLSKAGYTEDDITQKKGGRGNTSQFRQIRILSIHISWNGWLIRLEIQDTSCKSSNLL